MSDLLAKLDAMAEVEATLKPSSDTAARAAAAIRELLERLRKYELRG